MCVQTWCSSRKRRRRKRHKVTSNETVFSKARVGKKRQVPVHPENNIVLVEHYVFLIVSVELVLVSLGVCSLTRVLRGFVAGLRWQMGGVLHDDGAITIDSSRIEGCLVSGASRVGAVEKFHGLACKRKPWCVRCGASNPWKKVQCWEGLAGRSNSICKAAGKCSLGKRSKRHLRMSAIDERFVWAKKRRKERNIGCLLCRLQDVAG